MLNSYIPHTDDEIKDMLNLIGVKSIKELFIDIPKNHLINGLKLPAGLSEAETLEKVESWADENLSCKRMGVFIGGGVYYHFIPSVINAISQRSEFLTAYTPYQPEISQGSLQMFFEFQSMICELTGMETANSSMYDGGTAAAEAMLMACRISKKYKFLVSESLHPEYIEVIKTFAHPQGIEIETVPFIKERGTVDPEILKKISDDKTAGFICGYPNFFGIVENIKEIREAIPDKILCVSANPVALGVLKSPGEMGADIVTGEGQVLGASPYLGGMSLGFFASKKKYIRNMPGRIIGETKDLEGNRGYVMILQTREQHIRREKATSNICSNHAHNALVATIYLTLLGKSGIREIALRSAKKAHYFAKKFERMERFELKFCSPFFNEFVLESEIDPDELAKDLLTQKFIGPLSLKKFYTDPFFSNLSMFAVTEANRIDDINFIAGRLEESI